MWHKLRILLIGLCIAIGMQAQTLGENARISLLTCSPDNTPSKKTLEKLGGVLKENVDVPAWHWLYKRGETNKNIYYYSLK